MPHFRVLASACAALVAAALGCGTSSSPERGAHASSLPCVNRAHPHEGICVFPVRSGATRVRIGGVADPSDVRRVDFTGTAMRQRRWTTRRMSPRGAVRVPQLRVGLLIVGVQMTDGQVRVAHRRVVRR